MAIFALLVNPRDGRPHYAAKWKTNEVLVYRLDDVGVGEGAFNDSPNFSISEEITGLPRVHTPQGVTTRGGGLGTVLYTGLCAAAHLQATTKFRLAVGVSGDGCSSSPGHGQRSGHAERWWNRARTKYGLAERITGCTTFDFDKTWDSRGSAHVFRPEVKEFVASQYDATPAADVDLEEFSVSAKGRRKQCDVEADAYPYARAAAAHLVAGLAPKLKAEDWLGVGGSEYRLFGSLDPRAFSAMNVGSLWSPDYPIGDTHRLAIFNSLFDLARRAGCSTAVLAGMRLRYLTKSDVVVDDWTHPDYAWIEESVRANPARRLPRGLPKSARLIAPTRLRAKRMPTPRAVFYGPRKNPVDDRALVTELSGLAARRHALGWDVFAADPQAP